MWQRFTQHAQQAISYAQEETQNLGETHISTEHILLGLIRDQSNVASRVLKRMRASVEKIRKEVERFACHGESQPGDSFPFTPRTQRVIDLAFEEARLLNDHYIGTEHLLLGLIREEEGLAARILAKLGVFYTTALEQVKALCPAGTPMEQTPEPQRAEQSGMSQDVLDTETIHQLVTLSLSARAFAYAPYSRYEVGAAVLVEDGQFFSGCNIENASYGLSICAERVAIFNAVAANMRNIKAVAVATKDGGTPCGACRQVISEFADNPEQCLILVVKSKQKFKIYTLAELLPKPFDL